jgi:uncharacterized RDD family membrane protein YckC
MDSTQIHTLIIFPPLHTRIFAAVVDFVILMGGFLALSALYIFLFPSHQLLFVILAAAFIFCYEPVLVSTTGQTVGHKINRFRIINNKTTKRLNLLRASIRFLLKTTLGLCSLIWMLFTNRQRSLHDLLTGSLAINVNGPQTGLRDGVLANEDVATDRKYQQRSIKRRVIVSVLWLILYFIVFGSVELLVYPDCTNERPPVYCRNVDTIDGIITYIMLGSIFILGASGRLPGARRILRKEGAAPD